MGSGLIELADYIIENELNNSGNICTLFDEKIGFPYQEDYYSTFYESGKMIALSSDGRIFSCLRFYGPSLNNHLERTIGDTFSGVDMELVRAFMASAIRVQSDDEC